jgi:hypothetical protein
MTVARNAPANLPFRFSSMAADLDLDRPWLSEKLLAWPLLPSVDLRPESALSLRAFELPLLLVRGAAAAGEGLGGALPLPLPGVRPVGPLRGHPPRRTGQAEHLVTLPVREWGGFLWLPAGRALFSGDPRARQAPEVAEALAAARLPQEFARELNDACRTDPQRRRCGMG